MEILNTKSFQKITDEILKSIEIEDKIDINEILKNDKTETEISRLIEIIKLKDDNIAKILMSRIYIYDLNNYKNAYEYLKKINNNDNNDIYHARIIMMYECILHLKLKNENVIEINLNIIELIEPIIIELSKKNNILGENIEEIKNTKQEKFIEEVEEILHKIEEMNTKNDQDWLTRAINSYASYATATTSTVTILLGIFLYIVAENANIEVDENLIPHNNKKGFDWVNKVGGDIAKAIRASVSFIIDRRADEALMMISLFSAIAYFSINHVNNEIFENRIYENKMHNNILFEIEKIFKEFLSIMDKYKIKINEFLNQAQSDMAIIYNNLGVWYLKKDNITNAKIYFTKAIQYINQMNNKSTLDGRIYLNLGIFQDYINDPIEAKYYYQHFITLSNDKQKNIQNIRNRIVDINNFEKKLKKIKMQSHNNVNIMR